MLVKCCKIYIELPSTVTSIISGDGTRHFRRSGASSIIAINPRLRDGTLAAYICPSDVQLVALGMDHKILHAQTQLDIACDGKITLQYALDDCDRLTTELRVCVRVCGVLLVDVRVRSATFDGRTAGRLCGQHVLAGRTFGIAIHPAGTHLVATKSYRDSLNVYGFPDMNLLELFRFGASRPFSIKCAKPHGLCYTCTDTLLVAYYATSLVLHLTQEGLFIASYVIRYPLCVASYGDMFAVGTDGSYGNNGVHVYSHKSREVLHAWLDKNYILAIAFVDASTLAVSNRKHYAIDLHTLDGKLLRRLAADIDSHGLVMCADGYLLALDYHRKRMRVFASDGTELTTSSFATHTFQLPPTAIALYGERVYVLEDDLMKNVGSVRISVFE